MQSVKIFIFFTMLSLLMGCSSLSLNYVKNAEIVDISQADEFVITSKRSESTKLLLNGHYVKSGESLVFLIRRFEKGNLFVFDDESFEKLTIEIKNYKIGKPIKFGSTVVKFYYSRGNSPFIYKGHGLYSSHGTGYLIIKKQNKNSFVVDLDIEIFANPAGIFPLEGRTIRIKNKYIFNEKKIKNLTPWISKPIHSLVEEAYP